MAAIVKELEGEFGEDNIRERAKAYESTYAGVYDGATAMDIAEELCADVYAGINNTELSEIVNSAAEGLQGEEEGEAKYSKKLGGYFPDISVSAKDISTFGISNINNLSEVKEKVYNALTDSFISNENLSKPITNIDTGMRIEIWRGGINETFGNASAYRALSTEMKKAKLATMQSLAKLIKYGEVRTANINTPNSKNPSSQATFAYLTAPISIDGTTYDVNMDIKRTPSGNRFYIHKIRIASGSKVQGNTAVTPIKNPLATSYYAQNSEKVNTEGKYSVSPENEDTRFSLAEIDNYNEKTYNERGWVFVNDVLSGVQRKHLSEGLSEIRVNTNLSNYPNSTAFTRTQNGEYIIPVSNEDGVQNTFVYTDGNINDPKISSVVYIGLDNETDIDKVRSGIYEREKQGKSAVSSGVVSNYSEIITEYRPQDFESYQELAGQRANRTTAYHFDTDEQNGSGNTGETESIIKQADDNNTPNELKPYYDSFQVAKEMSKSGSTGGQIFNKTGWVELGKGNWEYGFNNILPTGDRGDIIVSLDGEINGSTKGSLGVGSSENTQVSERDAKGNRIVGGSADRGILRSWQLLSKAERNGVSRLVRDFTSNPSRELRKLLDEVGGNEAFAERIYADYVDGKVVAERWRPLVPQISQLLKEFDNLFLDYASANTEAFFDVKYSKPLNPTQIAKDTYPTTVEPSLKPKDVQKVGNEQSNLFGSALTSNIIDDTFKKMIKGDKNIETYDIQGCGLNGFTSKCIERSRLTITGVTICTGDNYKAESKQCSYLADTQNGVLTSRRGKITHAAKAPSPPNMKRVPKIGTLFL